MFLGEWKKIGKFRTRRFQQVKIFSLQILCLIVFTNPNPFEKKRKKMFLSIAGVYSMIFIFPFYSL